MKTILKHSCYSNMGKTDLSMLQTIPEKTENSQDGQATLEVKLREDLMIRGGPYLFSGDQNSRMTDLAVLF